MKNKIGKKFDRALKAQKDAPVKARMIAIRLLYTTEMSVKKAAFVLGQSASWVYKWLRGYGDEGIAGLRRRPRCGRPCLVEDEAFQA